MLNYYSATTCPLAKKRRIGCVSDVGEPKAKLLKQEIKEETDDDTVLLKEVSDIPCELVKVKEEPITEDDMGIFNGPETILVAPIKVKEEKDTGEMGKENDIDALRRIEQECARIQSENSVASVESEMDTILTPVAIQQQLQNVIPVDNVNVTNKVEVVNFNTQTPIQINSQGKEKENTVSSDLRFETYNNTISNRSEEPSSSHQTKEKQGDVVTPGPSYVSTGMDKEESSLGSRIVIKQDLNNDSDEEDMDDGGEYMVLAEWTDGKLEEAGSTTADKENDKDDKDQGGGKCKL